MKKAKNEKILEELVSVLSTASNIIKDKEKRGT